MLTAAATDGADAVDMDNFTGATSLVLDRTVGANDVTDVALTTGVTFLASSATADTTVTYKATGVTGASDSASVTLNGVTALADIELAGDVETINLTATGAASSLADLVLDAQTTTLNIAANAKLTVATTFTAAGVETLNVTGNSLVTITPALDAATEVVNASAQTAGGVSVILGGDTEFTGGAGDDVVDTTLNTTEDVVGGTGSDTVVFTDSGDYATTASLVSGFEKARFSGAGDSYNVGSLAGVTAIEAQTTAGTLTLTGLTTTNAASLKVLNSITTLVTTLNDATGTADALTYTIDDSDTTAGAITIGDITAAGVETINLVALDALTAGTAHVVSDFDGSTSTTKLNISSASTSDVTLSDVTDLASSATIDASTFTKKLTISAGLAAGDTVKGGTGNDAISIAFGSLGTTTGISGGTGNDTLTVTGDASDIVDNDFALVTGIDNIVISSTDTTSVTLSGYAQSAIASVDARSTGVLNITATGLDDDSTIDASGLISKGVNVTATLAINDNDAGALTITGSAVNDTITATLNSTGDTADAATGAINGGNGIDTITLAVTARDTGEDIFTLTSTATKLANADIITGFGTGEDQLDYNGSLTNAAATDGVDTTLALSIANQAAAGTYFVTANLADSGSNTSGTTFAALLGATASNLSTLYSAFEAQLVATGGIFNSTITGLDAEAAADETFLIVLDNGTGSVVLRATNSTATGNTLTVAELDLVGVFTNTVLATGDII